MTEAWGPRTLTLLHSVTTLGFPCSTLFPYSRSTPGSPVLFITALRHRDRSVQAESGAHSTQLAIHIVKYRHSQRIAPNYMDHRHAIISATETHTMTGNRHLEPCICQHSQDREINAHSSTCLETRLPARKIYVYFARIGTVAGPSGGQLFFEDGGDSAASGSGVPRVLCATLLYSNTGVSAVMRPRL